jgi:hypothetical protein
MDEIHKLIVTPSLVAAVVWAMRRQRLGAASPLPSQPANPDNMARSVFGLTSALTGNPVGEAENRGALARRHRRNRCLLKRVVDEASAVSACAEAVFLSIGARV